MSGTGIVHGASMLRAHYAMPGTDISYSAIMTMPDISYGAIMTILQYPVLALFPNATPKPPVPARRNSLLPNRIQVVRAYSTCSLPVLALYSPTVPTLLAVRYWHRVGHASAYALPTRFPVLTYERTALLPVQARRRTSRDRRPLWLCDRRREVR
eukprot:1084305-Rhodomonas_salina.5